MVCVDIKSIENDSWKETICKRGDEDISICQKGADGDDIEIRKDGDKEEEKRKENHFRPSQREYT